MSLYKVCFKFILYGMHAYLLIYKKELNFQNQKIHNNLCILFNQVSNYMECVFKLRCSKTKINKFHKIKN